MSDYPEHDKLRTIKEKSQTIGAFLEWLGEQRVELCTRMLRRMWGHEDLVPINEDTERILARYFEIDPNKLEAEKRAMLEAQRAANKWYPIFLNGVSLNIASKHLSYQRIIELALADGLISVRASHPACSVTITYEFKLTRECGTLIATSPPIALDDKADNFCIISAAITDNA